MIMSCFCPQSAVQGSTSTKCQKFGNAIVSHAKQAELFCCSLCPTRLSMILSLWCGDGFVQQQ